MSEHIDDANKMMSTSGNGEQKYMLTESELVQLVNDLGGFNGSISRIGGSWLMKREHHEPVRCRDCRFSLEHGGFLVCEVRPCWFKVDADGFCYLGEKRVKRDERFN